MHKPTAFRDKLTNVELDSIGLGDPSRSLRRRAANDLFLIANICVVGLLIGLALDLGDRFHTFVVTHEEWEIDEFMLAIFLGLIAFAGFSLRQWFRYSGEIRRRVKLERELVDLRILADRFGENKALFLSNLAHDFRTPLNGILGFAQLLQEEPFGPIGNEHYKTYVATIRESAVMLSDRIETCLDPEKVDFGAEPMQMIPFPLKQAVTNAMPVIQMMAQSADVTLEVGVPADLPEIHGDRRAIKKAVISLVTNAVKHSHRGGRIRVSAALTHHGDLAMEIDDNGIGLDATVIAAVKRYEPEASNAGVVTDSQGAELLVVKRLLHLHDASLTIENRLGHGTVITVTFPKGRLIPAS